MKYDKQYYQTNKIALLKKTSLIIYANVGIDSRFWIDSPSTAFVFLGLRYLSSFSSWYISFSRVTNPLSLQIRSRIFTLRYFLFLHFCTEYSLLSCISFRSSFLSFWLKIWKVCMQIGYKTNLRKWWCHRL